MSIDHSQVWEGVEFSKPNPAIPSSRLALEKLKHAFTSRSPSELRGVITKFPVYSKKNRNTLTFMLMVNFDQDLADILVAHDAFCGITFWGVVSSTWDLKQLKWIFSTPKNIDALARTAGGDNFQVSSLSIKPDKSAITLIPVLVNKLRPDALIEFIKAVDWPHLLRGGSQSSAVSSLILSHLTKRIAIEKLASIQEMAHLCDRFLDEDIINSLNKNRYPKSSDLAADQALQMDAFRDAFLSTTTASAARLQDIIKASPRLSRAWSDYWDLPINLGGPLTYSYRLQDNRDVGKYGLGERRPPSKTWLSDMIGEGHPFILETLASTPFNQPTPLTNRICEILKNDTYLIDSLFIRGNITLLIPALPKLATWLSDFKIAGSNIVHIAAHRRSSPSLIVSASAARVENSLILEKDEKGQTPMDIVSAAKKFSEAEMKRIANNHTEVRFEMLSRKVIIPPGRKPALPTKM